LRARISIGPGDDLVDGLGIVADLGGEVVQEDAAIDAPEERPDEQFLLLRSAVGKVFVEVVCGDSPGGSGVGPLADLGGVDEGGAFVCGERCFDGWCGCGLRGRVE
jgi:hypothetical protein